MQRLMGREEKVSEAIEKHRVVTLAYSLIEPSGKVLEERSPEAPLVYIHGTQGLHPAFEKFLDGKRAGFKGQLHLKAEQAYGIYREDLVVEMMRGQFKSPRLEVGMKFTTQGPDGNPLVVRVIEVEDDLVVVDGNHPLAGLDITFDCSVLDVRLATHQELLQGSQLDDSSSGAKKTIH